MSQPSPRPVPASVLANFFMYCALVHARIFRVAVTVPGTAGYRWVRNVNLVFFSHLYLALFAALSGSSVLFQVVIPVSLGIELLHHATADREGNSWYLGDSVASWLTGCSNVVGHYATGLLAVVIGWKLRQPGWLPPSERGLALYLSISGAASAFVLLSTQLRQHAMDQDLIDARIAAEAQQDRLRDRL